jgi:HSP20 family protein
MTATCPPSTAARPIQRKPRYEVHHAEDAYTLRVELPGVAKDAVSIDYDQGVLTLQAQRNTQAPETWKPLHRELNDQGYLLRLKLNAPVDEDKLNAQLADGILTLSLPVREAAKPRRIEVN